MSAIFSTKLLALLVVAALLGMACSNSTESQPTAAPETPTAEAQVERLPGELTYLQFCSTCHGETGVGDGPLASSLTTAPGNLPERVPVMTDDQIRGTIYFGIVETGMPAQADNLTFDEITDVISYIRTLAQ